MRAKLKAHAEEEQEASIREELEAAAAERPERSVKVVVEWAVPPPTKMLQAASIFSSWMRLSYWTLSIYT